MYDEKTGMDISKDKDWFFVMAKVVPWRNMVIDFFLTAILVLSLVNNEYESLPMMIVYLVVCLVSFVIELLTFIKSRRHYGKFVKFMNFKLLYGVVCSAVVFFGQTGWIVFVLADYFLWYKLNMKYYKNRLGPYADVY